MGQFETVSNCPIKMGIKKTDGLNLEADRRSEDKRASRLQKSAIIIENRGKLATIVAEGLVMRQIAVFFGCSASKHKCLGGRLTPEFFWWCSRCVGASG